MKDQLAASDDEEAAELRDESGERESRIEELTSFRTGTIPVDVTVDSISRLLTPAETIRAYVDRYIYTPGRDSVTHHDTRSGGRGRDSRDV